MVVLSCARSPSPSIPRAPPPTAPPSDSGFGAALGSNFFFAARSVLSTRVLRTGALSAGALYWLLCCIATVVTLPAALTLGQPQRLLTDAAGGTLVMELAVCGAAHFTYNMLSFQILQLCAQPFDPPPPPAPSTAPTNSL